MARTEGNGLLYFSHDTNMSSSQAIELLEAEHTIIGYAVWIKLLEKIFQEQGYYVAWNRKISLVFSKKIGVENQKVEAVILTCLEEGLFSKEMFEKFGILTSRRIQNNFLEGTKRRGTALLKSDFSLINNNKEDIVYDKEDIVNNTMDIVSNIPQSKVKESKVKESKVITASLKNITFAKLLFSEIKKNDQNAKEPNFEKWANDFRLLQEQDNRTEEEIRTVIISCQYDNFWKTVILSAANLRKHFPKLLMINKNGTKPKPATIANSIDDLRVLHGQLEETEKEFYRTNRNSSS